MNCKCGAQLGKCEPNKTNLCPASTHRLLYDTKQAMNDLYDFATEDKEGGNE